MSESQITAFAANQSRISISNEDVYAVLKVMGAATAEQIIDRMFPGKMDAKIGKRASQPVYRALSEGAAEGILDDTESVINPETGQPNTLYRIRDVKGPAKKREPTYKEKYESALEEIKSLKERCSFLVDQNARLRERLGS